MNVLDAIIPRLPPMKRTTIRFHGRTWLLLGTLEEGGPICTPEQFENFEVSYAFLWPNGLVSRFGMQVGTVDDIEVISEEEV